jgi:hypothetical protein
MVGAKEPSGKGVGFTCRRLSGPTATAKENSCRAARYQLLVTMARLALAHYGLFHFLSGTSVTHPATLVMKSAWNSTTLSSVGRNFPSARKYSGEVGVIDIFVVTSPV